MADYINHLPNQKKQKAVLAILIYERLWIFMDPLQYEFNRAKLSRLSRSFGMASLLSLVFFTSYFFVALGFGALAILFAYLSGGYGFKKDANAKMGTIFGSIGLGISILVVIVSFAFLFFSKEFQTQMFDYVTQIDNMYGLTGSEESLTSALQKLLGGMQ